MQKDFNIFGDNATIPLSIFMIAVCIIVENLCVWLGGKIGIWHVQAPLDKIIKKKDKTNIKVLFEQVLNPKAYKNRSNPDTPYEVRFNTFKWLNADRMKIEEDHNK